MKFISIEKYSCGAGAGAGAGAGCRRAGCRRGGAGAGRPMLRLRPTPAAKRRRWRRAWSLHRRRRQRWQMRDMPPAALAARPHAATVAGARDGGAAPRLLRVAGRLAATAPGCGARSSAATACGARSSAAPLAVAACGAAVGRRRRRARHASLAAGHASMTSAAQMEARALQPMWSTWMAPA